MAITSKDIAKELGISQSTVSRALRGDPRVAASTLQRVARGRPAAELHAEPRRQEPDHTQDAHGRRRRLRHHQSVLSGAARHPPQRVRARELPDDPAQRADRRPARAACRGTDQRGRGRRARLRVGRSRDAAPRPWRQRPPGRAPEPRDQLRDDRCGRLGQQGWGPRGRGGNRRTSVIGGSRSSQARRTPRRAGIASSASRSSCRRPGAPLDPRLRRVGPVQPQERLPVVPRPPRRRSATDRRVRRERRHRVRGARRRAPPGGPGSRGALHRRLRRHRHGRAGRRST